MQNLSLLQNDGLDMGEKTLSQERVFDGRLLKLDLLEIETASGTRGRREIVRHPGAVVIVARRSDGRFVLVRQYRKPLECYCLEMVAGTLEKGEAPAACARRELVEETGREAASLLELGVIFPAPGYDDECLHVFAAELSEREQCGTPDADEELEVVTLTGDEIEDLIVTNQISDAKTLASWLLYQRRVVKS